MSGALVVHLCTIWQRGQAVLSLLVLSGSRIAFTAEKGFRVTAGQKFHKSKKGERNASQRHPMVSLDTETTFQKSAQVM